MHAVYCYSSTGFTQCVSRPNVDIDDMKKWRYISYLNLKLSTV